MNCQEVLSPLQKPLYLTEEEALALLEMCLLTEAEDDPLKAVALDRLSNLCREFLRFEQRRQQVDRIHAPRVLKG